MCLNQSTGKERYKYKDMLKLDVDFVIYFWEVKVCSWMFVQVHMMEVTQRREGFRWLMWLFAEVQLSAGLLGRETGTRCQPQKQNTLE